MTWVYDVPLWVATIIMVGGMCAFSAAVLAVVWRFLRPDQEMTHNDVAGPIMGILGTVLAVMLSFMVVTVWQEYDTAGQGVDSEAASLDDLYHVVNALPASVRDPVRRDILQYLTITVEDEWPMLRNGEENPHSRLIALGIVHQVQQAQPATPGQQNVHADAIAHAHDFLDQRRIRLFNNQQTVPGLVWAMMFFIALVAVASSAFFYVPSRRAHMLMTIALGAVIGATFLLIAELDLPFRGPLQIPPHALMHSLERLPTDPY
jgi:hypothetical protein